MWENVTVYCISNEVHLGVEMHCNTILTYMVFKVVLLYPVATAYCHKYLQKKYFFPKCKILHQTLEYGNTKKEHSNFVKFYHLISYQY